MFPIFLDVKRLKVLLLGEGELARRRLKQLRDFGAENILFYDKLVTPEKMLEADIVMIVGMQQEHAQRVVDMARSMGKLVNVEDDIPNCDFFYASTVKRGDLTIAVGTSGKSPTLSRMIAAFLGQVFNNHWADYVERLGWARNEWRNEGVEAEMVSRRTQAMIIEEDMQPLADFLKSSKAEE